VQQVLPATPLIFTDLDGTLVDRDTYSWEAAKPALRLLREKAIPWVLVTSKTRAEVEYWRRVLGNAHPFAVENGAAAYVPRGYFATAIPGATRWDGYEVIKWGKPYAELVRRLEAASHISRCCVRGFHDLTAQEVAAACRLPIDQAQLAKQREYDEPFQIVDTGRSGELEAALAAQGLSCVRGGRFQHVCGRHDKGLAVTFLAGLFRRRHGSVVTVGLGDSWNDIPLLLAVDIPIVVRSPDLSAIVQRVPKSLVGVPEGPAGWNQAILEVIRNQDKSA